MTTESGASEKIAGKQCGLPVRPSALHTGGHKEKSTICETHIYVYVYKYKATYFDINVF